MSPSRICQTLREEHRCTGLFVERLQAMLGRHPSAPPDRADGLAAGVLRDLPSALGAELSRHFDFEEESLFPLLAAEGAPAIGQHLTEAHLQMRPLLARLLAVGATSLATGFDVARWSEFRIAAGDLCGQLLAHVEMEDMVLLPLLEENLDPVEDAALYDVYAGNAGVAIP